VALTLDNPAGYTESNMRTQRALLLGGSIWEIVRFFLLALLFAAVLREAVGAGSWVFPWLVAIGSGSLLISAAAGMIALFPERYDPLVAFLRLGKVLSAFSLCLLLISGALRVTAGIGVGLAGIEIPQGVILLFMLVLDLLFLAVLFSWRHVQAPPAILVAPTGHDLPEYSETEVGDYH
jgi:hypothetical protein